MTMQQQMKIKLLENKLKNTNDVIIKGALTRRIKQLKLQSRIDLLSGFNWNGKIHI